MRIGIFSDTHAQPGLVESILAEMEKSGVEQVWFLGDAVNIDDPTGSISDITLLQKNCQILLAGNHEQMFAEAYGITTGKVKGLWRLTLEGLGEILLTHGTPNDPLWGFPDRRSARLYLPTGEFKLLIHGHTHQRSCFSYLGGKLLEHTVATDQMIAIEEGAWQLGVGNGSKGEWLELDSDSRSVVFRALKR